MTLGALKRAVSNARAQIHLDQPITNVSALIIAISKMADLSNEISRQLNLIIRKIPRQIRLALNEVIRAVYNVADRGVELLKSIRAHDLQRRIQAADAEPKNINAKAGKPEHDANEIGKILKKAREASNLSILDVSHALKIFQGRIRSMESGRFEELPSRTYAIGFLRSYAKLVSLEPEPLLSSLRLILPQDWNRGFESLIQIPEHLADPPAKRGI